jgi:uncharacterized delta-60 repeat protein
MRYPSAAANPLAPATRISVTERLERRVLFAAGEFDPSFGQGGRMTIDFPGDEFISVVRDVAVQPDGKVLISGEAPDRTLGGDATDFALARLNPDGTPDTTFAGDGIFVFPFTGNAEEGSGVAVQADGKIVASGFFSNNDPAEEYILFTVLRFNPDGTLDGTWGTNGIVITPFGDPDVNPSEGAGEVLVGADGKITAVGARFDPDTSASQIALARYNPEDGSLDETFGQGGRVLGRVSRDSETAVSGAIQSDGKLVVTGTAFNVPASEEQLRATFFTARFNVDGSLDTGFGDGGATYSEFADRGPQFALAQSIAIQSDGGIVSGGLVGRQGGNGDLLLHVGLTRLNSDGSPDLSFAKRGVLESNLGQLTTVDQILVQDDGRIVCSGLAAETLADLAAKRFGALVVQYSPEGKLDKTFGSGGRVIVPPPSELLASSKVGAGLHLDGAQRGALSAAGGDFFQPLQEGVGGDFQDVVRRQAAVLVALEDRLLVLSSQNDQLNAAQLIGNGPDLVVGPFVVVKRRVVFGGGKGAAGVRVVNSGNAPVPGDTTVTLVLSSDEMFDAGDRTAGNLTLGNNLNPRKKKSLKFRFLFPTDLPDGTYFLIAVADPGASDVMPANNTAGSDGPVTLTAGG